MSNTSESDIDSDKQKHILQGKVTRLSEAAINGQEKVKASAW
jgi:hypothetical protein